MTAWRRLSAVPYGREGTPLPSSTEPLLLIPAVRDAQALYDSRIDAPVRRLAGATMGTGWSLAFAAPDVIANADVVGALEGVFASVIAEMSGWEPSSRLCAFNRAPAGSWHDLPAGFATVLGKALDIAARSGGAFNPALAAEVEHHGFGPGLTVDGDGVHGWRDLVFDASASRALQPGGVALDFSSIAKGYAVDRCAEALAALGVASCLMEIGGEFRGLGVRPDGQPWRVELELSDMPPAPGETASIAAAVLNVAAATSGDFVRRRGEGASAVSHLLDGRTGAVLRGSLSGLCVIHPAAMDADGWATALFALGPDEGMALAEAEGLAAVFAVRTPQGARYLLSSAARAMLE
jgi:thiamine biosynthesis lipoprotein